MTTSAPLTAECVLSDAPDSLAVARRVTRLALLAWIGDGPAVDDALLVVTELATNALRHGDGHPVLRLSVEGTDIRVEVFDDNPEFPVRRHPGTDGGWGLALVDRLSSVRGSAPHGRGKVVWCVLPASSAELAG
ncbi:ATP-binding protein [Amycolatopsis sp. Hca4]|uniref:ATP-binding protein n=1 Tax=unclassified Amycolatopsis TaxID=2618356 RepID=UPI0020CABFCA|nr:ATP-binding protein [Amycolatopsis sp. Hca4]